MRILTLIGTRPEAIKMAPVIKAAERRRELTSILCSTGQHQELLYPTLSVFGLKPDLHLSVMAPDQALNELFARLLRGIDGVIEQVRPDWILVHGDTSTASAGALAAFHRGVRVAHVEAGLRSGDMTQPWPEEMNRRLVDMLASLLFAPTSRAQAALLREGVAGETIEVTGNTVVDALLIVAGLIDGDKDLRRRLRRSYGEFLSHSNRILVTGHRRENFGQGIKNICSALMRLGRERDTCVLYPVHLNPNVQEPVRRLLSAAPGVLLIDPVDYIDFVFLMREATVIVTDSGGIQEEAPTFGVPALVMRNVTERPEAIEAGVARLVGTDPDEIVSAVRTIIAQRPTLPDRPTRSNPFGDGHAARRIVDRIALEASSGAVGRKAVAKKLR